MAEVWHLYEVVISNSRVWLKLQASRSSSGISSKFFEARFTGTNCRVDGQRLVTPFRLSQRSDHIANWASIVDQLPPGWDDDEFQIVGTPYPWCETLSNDCDCHGSKGGLNAAVCSDFGLHEEKDKLASKSPNAWYLNYIKKMEEQIARRDESRKAERLQRERHSPSKRPAPVTAKPAEQGGSHSGVTAALAYAINWVNRLVGQGFYCSIHGLHHAYSEQVIRKTLASVTATFEQGRRADRELVMSRIGDIAAHWLQVNQSKECAQRSVWGDVDIPDILYKYIPKERIGDGAPNSLRATQLLALNDVMECNVITMKSHGQEDTLAFLAMVQSKLEAHLGIAVPWEELLTRSLSYADVRLSTFIQEYLNPRVGVASFSTDILVPTMWAHYARNTGIVVGYDTEALRGLGFELRPVVYSEIAPIYQPSTDDTIRLDFVNREDMERDLRAGQNREGFPILARTDLAEFGADWKSFSRLLLVKGISWAYEKEVRLLVDLEHTHDIEREDDDGWPIKVIYPPLEAIREIYGGPNTQDADVERAVQEARGENKSGLFVGRLSSHAFRMQKTGGGRY